MKKDDIQKLISSGEATAVSINPETKTEISRRKIEGIVSDMKHHLAKNKKVHVIVVKE